MGGIAYSSPNEPTSVPDLSIEKVDKNIQEYYDSLCKKCMVLYSSIDGATKACDKLRVCLERAQADLHTIPWGSSKRLWKFQETVTKQMDKIAGII